jgi:hypothetical protein
LSENNGDNKSHLFMEHLTGLQPITLITTGRTGSDFLQSLLDSHTEVLTFNAIIWIHDFWKKSKCVSNNINLSDLIDEFIGLNIEKFKSRYDITERKDCLGDSGNEHIDIDLKDFKSKVQFLLNDFEVTSKNFLLAIYGAYALCLQHDLLKKKILFHHIHHAERLPDYLTDFPDSKIIITSRDPRANFVSGVTHWRKYDSAKDNEGHLYYYINRIIRDSYSINHYNNQSISIRIEDLGKRCILEALCVWLGINYEDVLEESTWAGLRWRGDRLSENESDVKGWSAKMLDNSWETKLSFADKYVLNFLMYDRLKHYGYNVNKIHFYDYFIVPLLLVKPLSFEYRYFTLKYLKESMNGNYHMNIIRNFVFFSKRVYLFYTVFFRRVFGNDFNNSYVKCADSY